MSRAEKVAFATVNRQIEWHGGGVEEQGIDTESGHVVVAIDPRYFRPTEVDFLLGDPSKAESMLGWQHRTRFPDLVREMIENDLQVLSKEGAHNER